MKKLTQEEEVLLAVFEGPVRPLTEEDQRIQDEVNGRYEGCKQARYEGYAEVLGLPFEQVEKMAKENIAGLVTQVTNRRLLLAIGCE